MENTILKTKSIFFFLKKRVNIRLINVSIFVLINRKTWREKLKKRFLKLHETILQINKEKRGWLKGLEGGGNHLGY